MTFDIEHYLQKRIAELTFQKATRLDKLEEEQMSLDEKGILELKISYYLAAGALAELGELKQVMEKNSNS